MLAWKLAGRFIVNPLTVMVLAATDVTSPLNVARLADVVYTVVNVRLGLADVKSQRPVEGEYMRAVPVNRVTLPAVLFALIRFVIWVNAAALVYEVPFMTAENVAGIFMTVPPTVNVVPASDDTLPLKDEMLAVCVVIVIFGVYPV